MVQSLDALFLPSSYLSVSLGLATYTLMARYNRTSARSREETPIETKKKREEETRNITSQNTTT